jgi:hypothetical protein
VASPRLRHPLALEIPTAAGRPASGGAGPLRVDPSDE